MGLRGAIFLFALAFGCGDDDVASDAAIDTSIDATIDADEPDAERPQTTRALILDVELRHVSSWVDVIGALEAAGLTTTYRRFYPHLTRADLDDFDVVVMAAGRTPAIPSSLTWMGEAALAAEFVQSGGALVLATHAGHRDSPVGANDWVVQNRILETLEVPMRIDRDTLLGDLYVDDAPKEPHAIIPEGYSTTLEEAFGYPWLRTTAGHPTARGVLQVAAGIAPRLRVANDEVDVVLRTFAYDYDWQRVAGTPEIVVLEEETPVAAVARAELGYVAAIPRTALTLSAASGQLADKPAHASEMEGETRTFVTALFGWLAALQRHEAELEGSEGNDDALFDVQARNVPALGNEDETILLPLDIDLRDPPLEPPTGELEERLPATHRMPARPAWMHESGGRFAYGGLPPGTPGSMRDAFGEIEAHALDVLMTSTSPEDLVGAEEDVIAAGVASHRAIAEIAREEGARWMFGAYLHSMYAARSERIAKMTGAQGQVQDDPDPLDDVLWDEAILPTCALTGRIAGESTGVMGLHFDLELYGGAVVHSDGYSFGDASTAALVSAMPELALLTDMTAEERFDYLESHGLLGTFFDVLEDAVAERATECRTLANAARPLAFSTFVPVFPSSWFHRGMLRGLGTAADPAIALTFEVWAGAPRQVLVDEGLDFVHLGGTLISFFEPDVLGDVLESLARGNDGYWFLSFNDLSRTNPMPALPNGEPAAYWDAIDAAHARLDR